MKLFDRRGRVRDRALTLLTLRGADKESDRLLIRFTYPNDIRGTGFLVWEHPQWRRRALPLPAVARPRAPHRRQRGAGKLRRQRLHATRTSAAASSTTTPTRSSTRTRRGRRLTVEPAGVAPRVHAQGQVGPVPARRVARPQGIFLVVQAEMFNRRNEREKTYAVGQLRAGPGHLDGAAVGDDQRDRQDANRAGRWTKIDYNTGLKEQAFTRRELEGSSQ